MLISGFDIIPAAKLRPAVQRSVTSNLPAQDSKRLAPAEMKGQDRYPKSTIIDAEYDDLYSPSLRPQPPKQQQQFINEFLSDRSESQVEITNHRQHAVDNYLKNAVNLIRPGSFIDLLV